MDADRKDDLQEKLWRKYSPAVVADRPRVQHLISGCPCCRSKQTALCGVEARWIERHVNTPRMRHLPVCRKCEARA